MADRSQALTAFINKDYKISLDFYTRALTFAIDKNILPILYSERSEVHVKLHNFDEALADANKAIELAPEMSMAYFRKGNACYQLKDYATAKAAFEEGSIRVTENVKFINYIKKCNLRIAGGELEDSLPQSSKRPRVDLDEVEAPVMEVAAPQRGGSLDSNAVARRASKRRHSKHCKKG